MQRKLNYNIKNKSINYAVHSSTSSGMQELMLHTFACSKHISITYKDEFFRNSFHSSTESIIECNVTENRSIGLCFRQRGIVI